MTAPPPEPLSPRAQALLDAARDGLGPDDAAIARMRNRIAAGAAGGAGVAAATKVVSAGALGTGAKLALAVIAAAAIGTGTWAFSRRAPAGVRDPVQPAARAAVQPSPPAIPAAPPAPAALPSSAPAPAARHDDPPPDVAAAPPAPAPRSKKRAPSGAGPGSLADEVALVDDAMAALRRDDAAAALAAADDHVARFGRRGQLAEEAAAIRVEALCALGDARWSTSLDDFDARFPRSAQRQRLTAACKGVQ